MSPSFFCYQINVYVWAVSRGDEHAVGPHAERQQEELEESLQGQPLSCTNTSSHRHMPNYDMYKSWVQFKSCLNLGLNKVNPRWIWFQPEYMSIYRQVSSISNKLKKTVMQRGVLI